MAFYGLKVATKDIDIILTSQGDLNNLQTTLKDIGYKEPNPVLITRAYNKMQTNAILENQDGFQMGPISKQSLQRPNTIWRNAEESNLTLPRQPPKSIHGFKRRPLPLQRNN